MSASHLSQNFSQHILETTLQNPRKISHQKRLAFFLTSLCVASLATPQIAPASAQATQATVQEILDGNQVFIQNKQAALRDVARKQQQVRTGNSRTALLFNTGAVARLSKNAVLKIGDCARLSRGTILINGAVNACSASITTGVRGTTYVLEIDEAGNQEVKVLEGTVVVKRNAVPTFEEEDLDIDDQSDDDTNLLMPISPLDQKSSNPPSTAPKGKEFDDDLMPDQNLETETQDQDEVVLQAGEKVEVDRQGEVGIIEKLTADEFVSLLQGNLFQGFSSQIPGIDNVRSAFSNLFPNVNFPISIPNIPTPSIPIPSFPSFPF
ncbi:FecR family protein [Pseudanabaena mucicola]|uniref:FecR protein domain-containing protein n=1 Tax=Pseudanabaena mucicola FACHB-723 TaxID=2692860 RepID=A0ABR7ZTZ2_9CYAN|nr:hypothetical protein [Pseudanabaena mucicola]MBD2187029.1 hypothetical protein [Pseudanabaena mucicola FACHB-723]